jgi:peptidoglycan-N-acetylglucosamine deacetylase
MPLKCWFLSLGRWTLVSVVLLAGLVIAQRQPLPFVQPPGALQPNAPGQRNAAALAQLELKPAMSEVKKVEYASNGFIEVAHALVLVPKREAALARNLVLAQEAVKRSLAARPSLNEVDVSVYLSEDFDGFGGPLPLLTASVIKPEFASFEKLQAVTISSFARLWLHPENASPNPQRKSEKTLEQTPTFYGSSQELRTQQVQQLSAQLSGRVLGGLLFHGNPTLPAAALTFDDAPHPLFEPLLLDTLRRAGVKATFFCIGRNAKAYPYFVKDMIQAGHEVGNHTFHHVRLPKLSESEVKDELEQANTTLSSITGQPVRYFRPPGGDYSRATLRIARNLGLTTTFWTDDPADFDNPGDMVIESRLVKKLRRGGIVLLHDNVLETIQVLPGFLKVAQTRGIKLMPVGLLVANN